MTMAASLQIVTPSDMRDGRDAYAGDDGGRTANASGRLRVIARMIARRHLARQAAEAAESETERAGAGPSDGGQGEVDR